MNKNTDLKFPGYFVTCRLLLEGFMTPLTKRQKEIYEYLGSFIDDNGYAPSYREIAGYFGYSSVATVAEFVEILRQKGYLNKEQSARSLQLTPTFDPEYYEIPLMGVVIAGRPIEAIRTRETIDIPRDMMAKNVFALKVRGDSMIEEGIFDNDYIIIEKTDNPKNGDIVVALLDNENVTLKRFYKEKYRIKLQPANKKYQPIYSNKVIIQGRVKGVIRKYT